MSVRRMAFSVMTQVNYEQIIRWDPEWIIAGAKGGNEKHILSKLMSDPAIALTQAARNGHIVVVDNRVFSADVALHNDLRSSNS